MNAHSIFDINTATGMFLNATTAILGFAALAVAYIALVDTITAARAHHRDGQPILAATARAAAEVLLARPLALHRSRMAVVRRCDAARAAAVEDAMLRHPSNFQARMECMRNHPANTRRAPALRVVNSDGAA